MISSAALPKVALRKPPIVGPDRLASSSVASPINPAAGISEIAAATNSQRLVSPVMARNQLMGATTSRTLSQLPVKDRVSCRAIDTSAIIVGGAGCCVLGAGCDPENSDHDDDTREN